MPITYKKVPDTAVPTTPVICCSRDESFPSCPARAWTPNASKATSPNTIVECPSENQKPIDTGRLPSAINLRVVLSIAAM